MKIQGWRAARMRSAERRTPRRRRLLLLAALGVAGAGSFGWYRYAGAQSVTPPAVQAPVTRGDLAVTVEGSGAVKPARSLDLGFQATGQVREVLVQAGAQVKAGQPLARLDETDLKLKVQQAEAALQTARARLTQAQEGSATEQELTKAAANVQSATANLQKTRTGNVTAADLAEAEAALRSAEAQLQQTRQGTATAEDIAEAEAQLRTAEAKLQAIAAGPTAAEASAAERQVQEAQSAYDTAAATASAAKTDAERAMRSAAERVRSAQDAYSTAYWNHEQARSGIDPTTGRSFADQGLDADVAQRPYAEALRAAERQLSQAQTELEGATAAYEAARAQEIRAVADAQATLDHARVQRDAALTGPSEAERVAARSEVDQARARLDKLRRGPTAADISSAQAQVDQARARLQKLRQGGTAADIAGAQAQVTSAQADLAALTAPQAASAVEIAQADVAQSAAQLEAARNELARATLTAPFDGVIAAVNVTTGSLAASGGSSAAFTLLDLSALQIDVALNEADVAAVTAGQSVAISLDALPDQTFTGTVVAVAPSGTSNNGVVTYAVGVRFQPGAAPVKAEMTASVTIEVERRVGVLQVPNRALETIGATTIVKVVPGPSAEPIPIEVTTGITNGSATEILGCVQTNTQCLREGDQLAISVPAASTAQGGPNEGGVLMVAPAEGGAPPPGAGPQRITIPGP